MKWVISFKVLSLFCCMFFVFSVKAATLSVLESSEMNKEFDSSELLNTAKKLKITDPVYRNKVDFNIVPIKQFLKKIPEENTTVLFVATDGFEVPISSKKLFYTEGLEAFVAVEHKKNPWPTIEKKKASAGPFYLVWTGPHVSALVGQEEWPYMVSKIVVQRSFEEEYPKLVPRVSKTTSIYKGFESFSKNCFACHALAKNGGEKLGPDLNKPFSPTQYMNKKHFKILVRNPQDLRWWVNSQMSSFDESILSDREIDNIWAYLKHMESRL